MKHRMVVALGASCDTTEIEVETAYLKKRATQPVIPDLFCGSEGFTSERIAAQQHGK